MTAWETVGFSVSATGGAFVGGTGLSGQTGTVRNTALGSTISLEAVWADAIGASIGRVRSPRLHDNVQGIRYQLPAGPTPNLLGYRPQTPLVPQDLLVVEVSDAVTEIDQMFLHISYASLPGSDGNYLSWSQISPRIVDIMTQEVTPGAPTSAGQWSAGVALNSSFDLMKANTWYALLGYTVNVTTGAIAIQGPDTGGLKVGGPGLLNQLETREWFLWNDEFGEEPAIPIINSANKAGTFVYATNPSAAYAGIVNLLFAELKGSTLQ
jgi:hypothetical protein